MDRKTLLIWLNIGLLILAWIMALSSYDSLPERIPTHFNFKGQPNAWGEKSPYIFFMLPVVQSLIVLLIFILLRYTHLYNFPQKKEVRNWPDKYRQPVYDFLKLFMLLIALLLNIMFLIIQKMIIDSSKAGEMNPYQTWFMLIITFMWLPLIIVFFMKMNKLVAEQRRKIAHSQSGQLS